MGHPRKVDPDSDLRSNWKVYGGAEEHTMFLGKKRQLLLFFNCSVAAMSPVVFLVSAVAVIRGTPTGGAHQL